MNKVQVYVFSFLCYTAIHSLRTAYSYVKNDISVYIDIESKLLGIVDALMLGFLGVGHFMHAVRSIKKPVYSLYIGMVLCGINFTLIPLFMKLSLSWGNFLILCILMSFNGFLQSYTWPNLLMIIHSKFDPEKYTVLLGFWATNANVGNIIGYALSILLIAVGCDSCWELQLIIAAIYAIINGFIIGVRFTEIPVAMIENLRKKSFQQIQHEAAQSIGSPDLQKQFLDDDRKPDHIIEHPQEISQSKQIETGQTKLKVTQVFKDLNVTLLTITFSLSKSVIYGIMLWLPIYFKERNDLKDYASQIPIAYDVSAIFGSVTIGFLFKKIINKGLIMIPFMAVLFGCFFLLRFPPGDLTAFWYFFIISIVGFCLGGIFNTLSGLVIMELTKVIPQKWKTSSLGFYSALTMAVGNITTALTQILIGFVIGKQQKQGIFFVFLIYAAVSFACLVFIAFLSHKKQRSAKIKNIFTNQCKNDKYESDINGYKKQNFNHVP